MEVEYLCRDVVRILCPITSERVCPCLFGVFVPLSAWPCLIRVSVILRARPKRRARIPHNALPSHHLSFSKDAVPVPQSVFASLMPVPPRQQEHSAYRITS
eukprot:2475221-Rhodomonas_salina.2